jgi:hypothetical protein
MLKTSNEHNTNGAAAMNADTFKQITDALDANACKPFGINVFC